MYEENIEKMNFKELRTEVQRLSDELAIFKRKYEDMIYNLESDNFGKSFTAQQDNMKAQIKVSADAIETKVSKDDLESTIKQTADSITSTVVNELDDKLKGYSTIEQTADSIQSAVVKNVAKKDAVMVTSTTEMTNTDKIYCLQKKDNSGAIISETYYYYNSVSNSWEILDSDSIYSVFKQTEDGFEMKGNVLIDGNAVVTKNLKLSGNVTWDMSNSPVLSQYSANRTSWHDSMQDGDSYMRMSFDGGKTWSNPTKVVGTDGKDGTNGTNANVTAQEIFDFLTDSGKHQGLFSAFVNNENQLYINAEFLKTRIAVVADSLSIGTESDTNIAKKILFNTKVGIETASDGVGYYSLKLNCNKLYLPQKPGAIYVNKPTASSTTYITLENYVGDRISSGISGLATEDYVDDAISDIDTTAVFG